jgi:hypothetical protein
VRACFVPKNKERRTVQRKGKDETISEESKEASKMVFYLKQRQPLLSNSHSPRTRSLTPHVSPPQHTTRR